jgi:ferredoxin
MAVPDDVCVIDAGRCVGCGLCFSACPTEALSLQRRPEGEILPPPADNMAWMMARAEARGLDGIE